MPKASQIAAQHGVQQADRGGRGAVRRPEELDPESVSGRGLTLVDALASAWSAEHSTDGTTVWFELALAGAPTPSDIMSTFGE